MLIGYGNGGRIEVGGGKGKLEMPELFHDQACNDKVSVPFPVPGDTVPGGFRSGCFFNEVLVGGLEFIPAVAVIKVIHAEFPKLVRILKP